MRSEILEKLRAEYESLCANRDSVNAGVAALVASLEKANAEAEEARVRAAGLAERIFAIRGGEEWLALKREIGKLAAAIMQLK